MGEYVNPLWNNFAPQHRVENLLLVEQNKVNYRDIRGKPYITVSARGISNGLSDIPNDGADFGPDTPNTQTTGIQEAINYATSNQKKIIMGDGVFYVTAPFTAYPAGTSYGQILLPYNPSPNTVPPTPNPIFIEIEGFGGLYGDANGSGTSDGQPVPTGGTVIFFQPPSTPSSTTIGEYSGIDGGDQSISNYIMLKMTKVTLRQNPNPQFANMQVSAIANLYLDQIRNDIYFSINATTSTDLPPISPYITGIGIVYLDNNGINNRLWGVFTNVLSVGYYYGNVIQPSSNVFYANIVGLYCQYGLYVAVSGTGHQIEIYNYVPQACPYGIYFVNAQSSTCSSCTNLTIHNYIANRASNYVADLDAPSGTTGFIEYETQYLPTPNGITSNASGIFVVYKRMGGPYVTKTPGTTAGTIVQRRSETSNYYMKYVFIFDGYENNTTTDQSIGFSWAFTTFASVVSNTTGLTVSVSTTALTITAPNSTTTYSGIVIVEGY